MTILDPSRAARLLATTTDPKRITDLADSYGWVAAAAHTPHVGDRSGGGARGVGDPTSATEAQRAMLRREVRKASAALLAAATQIAAAEAAVVRALALADPGRHTDGVDPGPCIARSELDEARAAKVRRDGRGERYGA